MNAYVRRALQEMGRQGGLARKARLSKERLSEIGRLGAKKRWENAAMLSTTLLCKGTP